MKNFNTITYINIGAALNKCNELQHKLKATKDAEIELRRAICDYLLSGESIGAHKYSIDRLNVVATKKVTTSILEKELEEIYDDLTDEERECIKFKPSLIAAKYKGVDSKNLEHCIVTKPAMPTLRIEHEETYNEI